MSVISRENQSMLDLALMAAGTIECVFELAESNGIDVTGRVVPGTKIITNEVVTIDQDIFDYYNKYKISPASIDGNQLFVGIGFMIIGTDFQVG